MVSPLLFFNLWLFVGLAQKQSKKRKGVDASGITNCSRGRQTECRKIDLV